MALSAVDAKGLDVETVVVFDAGARQADLQCLVDRFTTAVTTRDELADAVPQVLDRLDRMLVRWIRRAADTPLRNPTTSHTVARTMRTTADRLATPHRYVNTTIDKACSTWATAHHAARNAALGLEVLTQQHTTDRAVRAMCLEQLGRLTEAIDDDTAAKRSPARTRVRLRPARGG